MSHVLNTSTVVSRKRFVCDLCYEDIEPKTKYVRQGCTCDGDIFDCHYHVECYEFADATFSEDDWECGGDYEHRTLALRWLEEKE